MLAPANLESEAAMLGNCVFDPSCLADCLDRIKSREAFSTIMGQNVWDAITSIASTGSDVTLVAIRDWIVTLDLERTVGDYLLHIAASYDPPAQDYHLRQVLECFQRRETMELAGRLMRQAADMASPIQDTLDTTVTDLDKLGLVSLRDDIAVNVGDLFQDMDAFCGKSRSSYIKTAKHLNESLEGLERGGMHLIGAFPGVGKTTMAIHLAIESARAGSNALIVTLEMTAHKLAERMLAMSSGRSVSDMRQMDQSGVMEIASGFMADIGRGSVWLAQDVYRVGDICALIRRAVRKHKIDLAVVDYLQQVDYEGAEENSALHRIGRRLAAVARLENVALLVPAQLNRNIVKMNRLPILGDISGSSGPEQAAFSVSYMARLQGKSMLREGQHLITHYYVKNRNGPMPSTTLLLDGPTLRFLPWSDE